MSTVSSTKYGLIPGSPMRVKDNIQLNCHVLNVHICLTRHLNEDLNSWRRNYRKFGAIKDNIPIVWKSGFHRFVL